jgi:hypothetical protein
MKNYIRFMGMILLAAVLAVSACDNTKSSTKVLPLTLPGSGSDITFLCAIQTGGLSGTVESTGLVLVFNADPTTLMADNITVTGAAKGTLTGSGISRNLAISDINVADGGSVTVAITSPTGYAIAGTPRTAAVYRITLANMTIGMDYRGGKLAYILQSGDPGYDAAVPHGLITAASDQGENIEWGCQGTYIGTSTALGTGMANTRAIVNGCGTAGIAARICDDLVLNGFSDWYLPSKDELNKLNGNGAAIGMIDFSITRIYWNSSEYDATYPWHQYFDPSESGQYHSFSKKGHVLVRAVRSF